MMQVGDIYRLKTSGENVVILLTEMDGSVTVRRAQLTRDGYRHYSEKLAITELETVEASIQREFDEMLQKNKMMENYLKKQKGALSDLTEGIGQIQ